VDDFTRAIWVYFIFDKSQIGSLHHNFCLILQNQFGNSVNIIRVYNDCKFFFDSITQFYAIQCIIHHIFVADSLQQNNPIEHKHLTCT